MGNLGAGIAGFFGGMATGALEADKAAKERILEEQREAALAARQTRLQELSNTHAMALEDKRNANKLKMETLSEYGDPVAGRVLTAADLEEYRKDPEKMARLKPAAEIVKQIEQQKVDMDIAKNAPKLAIDKEQLAATKAHYQAMEAQARENAALKKTISEDKSGYEAKQFELHIKLLEKDPMYKMASPEERSQRLASEMATLYPKLKPEGDGAVSAMPSVYSGETPPDPKQFPGAKRAKDGGWYVKTDGGWAPITGSTDAPAQSKTTTPPPAETKKKPKEAGKDPKASEPGAEAVQKAKAKRLSAEEEARKKASNTGLLNYGL